MKQILILFMLFPFVGQAQKAKTSYLPLAISENNSIYRPTAENSYDAFSIMFLDENKYELRFKNKTEDGRYKILGGFISFDSGDGIVRRFKIIKIDENSFKLVTASKTIYYFIYK